MDDLLLLGGNEQLLNNLKKQFMDRFETTNMGDVSRMLGMNVARDREKGKITIDQKYSTQDVERFSTKDCNPAFTPGVRPELLLNRPRNNLLDEEGN